jgi:glycosyltransferase involved in cell wall biosynthesis
MGRPSVAFVAWTPISGRSAEIADAVGGEAFCLYDLRIAFRPLIPIRYAVSLVRTIVYLIRRRPRAAIVTNPPIFPALVVGVYARLARVPFVLDSHPSGFGIDDRIWSVFEPLHRRLVRRAAATIVTGPVLAEVVARWGGRPEVVHEAPPAWKVDPPAAPARRQVLSVCTFAPDEPVRELVAAAALVPDVEFAVTGDRRLCPADLHASAPPNVTFTGFLHGGDYVRAISAADVILALTKRPEAVNRAAYEGVYAGRPTVISDFPAQRELFGFAVAATNDPEGIASAVREAFARHEELVAAAQSARDAQTARWAAQLDRLRAALGLGMTASEPIGEPVRRAETIRETVG